MPEPAEQRRLRTLLMTLPPPWVPPRVSADEANAIYHRTVVQGIMPSDEDARRLAIALERGWWPDDLPQEGVDDA